MEINLTKTQKWVGAITATVGLALVIVNQAWPVFGWTTPAQHKADIDAVEEDHSEAQEPVLSAIRALSVKVDVNQLAWQCDEDIEELIDLKKAQVGGDTSVETQVEIDELADKIDENDCNQFK